MTIGLTHRIGIPLRPGKSGTDVSIFDSKLLELNQSTEFKLLLFLMGNVISERLNLQNAGLWELDDQR